MSVILHHGKLEDVLPTMAAESIDAVVTDTPYHLTAGKKGGSGDASVNPNSPAGRSMVTTGFMGQKWDGGDVAFRVETWREVFRVLKPGAHLLAFGGTRTHHRLVCAIEDAGFEIRDELDWVFFTGFPKSSNQEGEWDGWGTALKPYKEPICLARKPLVGTVPANLALHRTGAINIDGCRIPGAQGDGNWEGRDLAGNPGGLFEGGFAPRSERDGVPAGRWPAGLIHDGSPQVLAEFPYSAGACAPVTGNEPTSDGFSGVVKFGGMKNRICQADTFRGDDGSASRFFFCAKASAEDREDGCDDLPARQQDESRKEGNPGGDNPRNRGLKPRANFHPTVKPTNLMRWLCRLIAPPGGTVLDCFMGSGSTGRGAVLEGFNFVGIEMTNEYLPIARARIAAAEKQKVREDEEQKHAAAQSELAL